MAFIECYSDALAVPYKTRTLFKCDLIAWLLGSGLLSGRFYKWRTDYWVRR